MRGREKFRSVYVRPRFAGYPVTTEGAKERTLYLPAGNDQIDFWTGKRVRGGQSINAEAPLDRIPIYARAG